MDKMPRTTTIGIKGAISIPKDMDRASWKIVITDSDGTAYDVTEYVPTWTLTRVATVGLSNFSIPSLDNHNARYKDKFAAKNTVDFYYDLLEKDSLATIRMRGYIDNVLYGFDLTNGFHLIIEGRDSPISNTNEHFADTHITLQFNVRNNLDCWLGVNGTADDEGNLPDGILYNSGLVLKVYDTSDSTWKEYKDLSTAQKDTLKLQEEYTQTHTEIYIDKSRLLMSKKLAEEGDYDFRIHYELIVNEDIVQSGLIQYYTLNGVTKDSIGTLDGISTDMAYTDGQVNVCGNFNGSSSKIMIPGGVPTMFDNIPNNDFSISLWAYARDFTTLTQYLIEIRKNGVNYAQIKISSINDFTFSVKDSGDTRGKRNVTGLDENQWYHIVGTWDADTDTVHLYIDTVQQVGTNSAASSGTGEQCSIGVRTDSWGYFDGLIDDVRVYDKILSSDEISELYNAPNTSIGKTYLMVHPEEAILNNNEPVQAGQNLIAFPRYGSDTTTEFNRIKEQGIVDDTIITLRTKQDTSRQSALWIKDKEESNSAIKDDTTLANKALATLNLLKQAPQKGNLTCCALPSLQPAEKIPINLPYTVNENIKVKGFTINGGKEIEFNLDLKDREATFEKMFKDTIDNTTSISVVDNPNGMRNAISLDFSDSAGFSLFNTQIVNGVLSLEDGQTQGTCETPLFIADEDITQFELRVKANQMWNCTYRVSNDNGVTYTTISLLELFTFTTTGKQLLLEVTLNQSTSGVSPGFNKLNQLYI